MWARTEASRRFRVSGNCPESCTRAARRSVFVGTERELHWPTRQSRGFESRYMHWNSLTSATRSLDAPAWRWVFDSGSLFRGEGSALEPFRQKKSRLFSPFASTKQESGSGLGLWVSRSILDKHDGTIRVSSADSGYSGTTVSIFLPLKTTSRFSADDTAAAAHGDGS